MDFKAGALLAILIDILPIGFWLTLIFSFVMVYLAISFVRGLNTPATPTRIRALRIIIAVAFVVSISYKPLVDRYKEENEIPFVLPYLQTWGTPVGNVISPTHPAKLASGPGTVLLSVDGTRLLKFKDKSKLVGVIGHALLKNGDYNVSSAICKSTAYTITDGVIVIPVPLCQSYMDEIVDGAPVEHYWLLAIPIDFDQSYISSLSEAEKHGARLIGVGQKEGAKFYLPQQPR